MHMVEREWTPASNCFFDAFRNYDEAGYPRRIQCLKCAARTCHSRAAVRPHLCPY